MAILAAFLGLAASFEALVGTWGYLGIFIVSLVSSASIIFPLPGPLLVAAAALVLNPWLVGIAAGVGGGIGEITGWLAGRAGKAVLETKQGASRKKPSRWLSWAERWAQKRGMFPVIILFAATPLPMDIIGLLSGLMAYDWRKFLIAAIIGKTALCIAIALAASYGTQWLVSALTL